MTIDNIVKEVLNTTDVPEVYESSGIILKGILLLVDAVDRNTRMLEEIKDEIACKD